MKREELDVCTLNGEGIETWMVDCEGTEIWTTDSNGNKYYYKSQADSVMDAMEQRIKELEEENKHLDDYLDAYQKSEALNIEKLDKKDERIKELEEKLAMKLDPALHPTCADCDKCSVVISKMETTTPKWISVKDRLPKEGEEVIAFYTSWKHKYQQVAMFESGEFIDLGGCALSPTHWMELPPPPKTEG